MSESILIFAGINIILALSFYITSSTGQISLGHGAFMGIGAYASAYLTVNYDWPLFAAIVAALLISGFTGFVVGFPALRIKGIYLAIATLGFGMIVNVIFRNWQFLGGASGFSGMEGTTLTNVLVYCLLVLLFVLYVNRTRLGWSFKAVNQDETAAQLMGINVVYAKICAFTMSAAIAGIGGALYAHYMYFIEPNNFSFHASLLILFYVLFGGVQNPWGAVVGAILLTLLPELFRGLEQWRMVFYGIVIVVMMIVRPQGLITDATVSYITSLFKRNKVKEPLITKQGGGQHAEYQELK